MAKILTLDQSRKKSPAEGEADAKDAPGRLHALRPNQLRFEPKAIPPADRHFPCHFCGDIAARWFEVSQNNIVLIFEEIIHFCLDPLCARRARREITEISPFPSQPSLLRLMSKIPVLGRSLFFPKNDKDD